MTNVSAGLLAVGQAGGVPNFATGLYTGDGAAGAMTVNLGFSPKYVRVEDITDGMTYEWMEGLAATDTIATAWSTGIKTVDTNSNIVSNMQILSATENALNAPGAQGPGEGVSGTTTVSYESPNKAIPNLVFNAGSSGARMNVSSSLYVWYALG